MKDRNHKGRFSSSIRFRLTPRMEGYLNNYVQENETTMSAVLRTAITQMMRNAPEDFKPTA
jgi:hypothetical protein